MEKPKPKMLSFRVAPETDRALERLAFELQKPKAHLAEHALQMFVERMSKAASKRVQTILRDHRGRA